MEEALKKELHELIDKRHELLIEKREIEQKIIYIKGVLLLPERNNEFYKNQLSTKQKEYKKILSNLDNITKRFKLLCAKLRIVKINLKQDNFLKENTANKKNLSEAINNINCYGCVETGEIFDGPSTSDNEVPITNLDRFELTVKTYRKIISNNS